MLAVHVHGSNSAHNASLPSPTPKLPLSQSMVTTAPRPFIVSMIFSDSSFGTPSFICFGALSTNFLLSTKLNPNMPLISLITLGFDAASNDLSVRVKRVFSCAAGAASSSSTGAAGAGAAAAEKPPMGMSGILRRDCRAVKPRQHSDCRGLYEE